jgi:peptide/nickel transport system substrate-binding protein
VRRALFQALDRDLITQEIFQGYGEAAIGTQPKLSPAYAPDRITTRYPFDPQAAQTSLDEAGWRLNDDGVREKDGQRFEFDLLLTEGSATVEQMAVYLQEAWSAIGVRANVRSTSGATLLEAVDSRDFEMILIAFSFGPDGGQGPLFTCDAYAAGFNFMRYCNPRYDELEQLQRRELDPARRVDLMIEQANIVWNDLPVGPIRFGVGRTGATTRLHNFYPNGYGFLWSLPYVWIEE